MVSTGQKPTSGDLDLAVDPKTISKDDLVAKLTKWAESHGFDPKEWIRKSQELVYTLKHLLLVEKTEAIYKLILCLYKSQTLVKIFNESRSCQ